MDNSTQNVQMTDQSKLVLKIKNTILTIADDIEETDLDSIQLEFKKSHMINNLLISVSNLNLDLLEQVYDTIQESNAMKKETARFDYFFYILLVSLMKLFFNI
jgi:hypothetical protein